MQAKHSGTEKEGDPAEMADEELLGELTEVPQKGLPPLKPHSLSAPLAFACLPHRASGKNLKLEGTEDLSDVLVRQQD